MVNVAYFFSRAGNEMRDVRRVLKSGGRAVVYVTDRATMQNWSFTRTGHHRLFDSHDLADAMIARGFERNEITIRPANLGFRMTGLLSIAQKPT